MIGFGVNRNGRAEFAACRRGRCPGKQQRSCGAWAPRPLSGPLEMSSNAAPAPASSTWEEEPSVMQDAGEVVLPSVSPFDAPPASWGARALAALGGQAGMAPRRAVKQPAWDCSTMCRLEPAEPNPPDFAPVRASSGRGGLRDSRPFALG